MKIKKKCISSNCKNNSKNSNKRFFHFPKCKKKIQLWKEALTRDNNKLNSEVSANKFVCEDHFRVEEIKINCERARLVKNAVPFPLILVDKMDFEYDSIIEKETNLRYVHRFKFQLVLRIKCHKIFPIYSG
jgi:hypothetical protein